MKIFAMTCLSFSVALSAAEMLVFEKAFCVTKDAFLTLYAVFRIAILVAATLAIWGLK